MSYTSTAAPRLSVEGLRSMHNGVAREIQRGLSLGATPALAAFLARLSSALVLPPWIDETSALDCTRRSLAEAVHFGLVHLAGDAIVADLCAQLVLVLGGPLLVGDAGAAAADEDIEIEGFSAPGFDIAGRSHSIEDFHPRAAGRLFEASPDEETALKPRYVFTEHVGGAPLDRE